MKQHRPGHPILNTSRDVHAARMIKVRPGDDIAWKCPLCDIGITKVEATTMTRSVVLASEILATGVISILESPKERWKEILGAHRKRQGIPKAVSAARRIRQMSQGEFIQSECKAAQPLCPFPVAHP